MPAPVSKEEGEDIDAGVGENNDKENIDDDLILAKPTSGLQSALSQLNGESSASGSGDSEASSKNTTLNNSTAGEDDEPSHENASTNQTEGTHNDDITKETIPESDQGSLVNQTMSNNFDNETRLNDTSSNQTLAGALAEAIRSHGNALNKTTADDVITLNNSSESNDLSSIQDIQGKGLAGLIKPILNQGSCPPVKSLSCLNLLYSFPCNNDDDCFENGMTCCNTKCAYGKKMCIPRVSAVCPLRTPYYTGFQTCKDSGDCGTGGVCCMDMAGRHYCHQLSSVE